MIISRYNYVRNFVDLKGARQRCFTASDQKVVDVGEAGRGD